MPALLTGGPMQRTRLTAKQRFFEMCYVPGVLLVFVAMLIGVAHSLISEQRMPEVALIYSHEIDASIAAQDYQRALGQLRLAADIDFGNQTRLLELAEAARAMGDLEGQLFAAKGLSRLQPRDPKLADLLASLYLQADRPLDAAVAAARAVRREPNNPDYRCRLGTALLAMDEKEKAAEQFQAALQLDPFCKPAQLAMQFPLADLSTSKNP